MGIRARLVIRFQLIKLTCSKQPFDAEVTRNLKLIYKLLFSTLRLRDMNALMLWSLYG